MSTSSQKRMKLSVTKSTSGAWRWRSGAKSGAPPQPYHFDRYTKPFKKTFDLLVLRNGYRPDSPTITLKNPNIRIGQGRPEWGAERGKNYFVITWKDR